MKADLNSKTVTVYYYILKPRLNGHHFEDILNFIFLYDIYIILIQISLKFVSHDPINNKPALVQTMAFSAQVVAPSHYVN